MQSAVEMLEDAKSALSGEQPDLARSLFEQVILSYPDSPEADRATVALSDMNRVTAAAAADHRPQIAVIGEHGDAGDRPAAPPSMSIDILRKDFLVHTGDRVFFAPNSAAIGARAKAMLENQARWLRQRPEIDATIIGRADDDGAPGRDVELSRQRAEAVRAEFIALGVAADRLHVEARGSRDPVATCRAEECRIHNRLAETMLQAQSGVTGSLDEPVDRTGARAADMR